MTNHLTVLDVVALHEEIMRLLGFAPAPLRDQGALESAVMRTRMAEAYDEADIIRQAALLAIGISQAQAFLDGNKRTAYAAIDTFLRVNGFAYAGDPVDLAKQLESVA
jgi:death-on-curing protein